MCDLTREEKDIIRKVLISAPLQGTMQTLPKALEQIAEILKKLEEPKPTES